MKFNELEKSEEEDYNYIMSDSSELDKNLVENLRRYFKEQVKVISELSREEDTNEVKYKKILKDVQNYLGNGFFREKLIEYQDSIFHIDDNEKDVKYIESVKKEKEYFNKIMNANFEIGEVNDEEIDEITKKRTIRKINRFYNILLKLTHTSRVVKDTDCMLKRLMPEKKPVEYKSNNNARNEEANKKVQPIVKPIILYAALYHDIGRFYEAARNDAFAGEIEDGTKVNLDATTKFDHAMAGYWYGLSDGLDYEANIEDFNENKRDRIIKSAGAIIVMLHQQSNSELKVFDEVISDEEVKKLVKAIASDEDYNNYDGYSLARGIKKLYEYAASKDWFMEETPNGNSERIIEYQKQKGGKADIGSACVSSIDKDELFVGKALQNIMKLGLHVVMGLDRIDILRQWEKGTYPAFETIFNPDHITIDLYSLIDTNKDSQITLKKLIYDFIDIKDEEKQRKIAYKIIKDTFFKGENGDEEKVLEILETNIKDINLYEENNQQKVSIKSGEIISKKTEAEVPVYDLRPYTDEEIVEKFILGGKKRFEEFTKDMSKKPLDGIAYKVGILGLLWNINQFIFVNARCRGQLEIIQNQNIISNIKNKISEFNVRDENRICGEAIARASEKYFKFTESVLQAAIGKDLDDKNQDDEKKDDEKKGKLPFCFKRENIESIIKGVKTSEVKKGIDGVKGIIMPTPGLGIGKDA